MPPTNRPVGGGTSTNQNGSGGARQRILRIGILLGGKIVEERLIRDRVPVSIGQMMKNTFSIPVEGLPPELTLFALDDGRYSLRFLSKMDGRISESNQPVKTLEELKSKGAVKSGDTWQVPLSDSARGKLTLGDLTILFQFVTEPPRQPKPMLPASVRGTFADRFDPRLVVIVGASILAHFTIVLLAYLRIFGDPPVDSYVDQVYDLTFEPDKYKIEAQLEPEPVADGAGSAAGSAAAPTPKPADKPSPKPAANPGGGRKDGDSVAMSDDDAVAFADKLTGEGPNGKDTGGMADRRPGADLDKQIDNVRAGNKDVVAGGGSGRGSRGSGDPRTGTGSGPKIDAPGGIDTAGGGKVAEKGPAGRISVSTKQALDETSLTADAVLAKIQSVYMQGLKRCYKQYLNKDASARGRVTLSFKVTESGNTVNGQANGFASEVDQCIAGLMGGWRFPVPKDKDGDASEASFSIALQLVPD